MHQICALKGIPCKRYAVLTKVDEKKLRTFSSAFEVSSSRSVTRQCKCTLNYCAQRHNKTQMYPLSEEMMKNAKI